MSDPSPAEHAILGLLYLEHGGHGYDLARAFSENAPLGAVIKLEPGMLYHHLKKLHKAGLLEQHTEQSGNRPPRQVFRVTAAGKEELRRWLQEPVAHTREIRLEFLLKLFFSRILDPGLARILVQEQKDTSERQAARIVESMKKIPKNDRSPEEEFLLQVQQLRLMQTEAAVKWLNGLSVDGT